MRMAEGEQLGSNLLHESPGGSKSRAIRRKIGIARAGANEIGSSARRPGTPPALPVMVVTMMVMMRPVLPSGRTVDALTL